MNVLLMFSASFISNFIEWYLVHSANPLLILQQWCSCLLQSCNQEGKTQLSAFNVFVTNSIAFCLESIPFCLQTISQPFTCAGSCVIHITTFRYNA